MTHALNITADEITAFTQHFDIEVKNGFDDQVEIVKTLVAGDNTLSREAYYEIYDMLHRSLERLENEYDTNDGEYAALMALATKLDIYDDTMYTIGAWR